MTDSAVLDTILGLIFLFYALALLCGGLVEMIANWVQKRAKYLLRGIGDLLADVEDKATAVPKRNAWAACRTTYATHCATAHTSSDATS